MESGNKSTGRRLWLLASAAVLASWMAFKADVFKPKSLPKSDAPVEVAKNTRQVSEASRQIRALMEQANPFIQFGQRELTPSAGDTDLPLDDEILPKTLPEIADAINQILDSLNSPTGDLTTEDFDRAQLKLSKLLNLAVDLFDSVSDPALDDFCEDLGVTRKEMGDILLTQYEALDKYYRENSDSMDENTRAQIDRQRTKLNLAAYMFYLIGPLPRNE